MTLLRIAKDIASNPDGSMSEAQKTIWKESVKRFMIPGAQNNHEWASHFFSTTGAGKGENADFGPDGQHAFIMNPGCGNDFVDLHPEVHVVLSLRMILTGLRRNSCPALSSVSGKQPALMLLGEIVRRIYDTRKIQSLIAKE